MSKRNLGDTEPVHKPQPEPKPEDQDQVPGPIQPVFIQKEQQVEATQPVSPAQPGSDDGQMEPTTPTPDGIAPINNLNITKIQKRTWHWLLVLLGVILVVLFGGTGIFLGYQKGIQIRLDKESNQIALAAVTQFQLALADEGAGRYEMARKRYEYVIQIDPSFPNVEERLTNVMYIMARTAAPTEVPTPTPIPLTPTPDTRDIDEKFNNAWALFRAADWNNAIASLEVIRKEDIQYRAADIDGMFYIALRFRGMQKILSGSLEQGIYDLALAERFAPLDKDADSYRSWARYYLTGSSFWEIDWEQVVQIFGEIYPYLPNLRDGSGWTAQERFRVGCIEYAKQLASKEMWCDARHYYDLALALAADPQVIYTATAVALICEPPTPTPTETPLATLTPTPTATEDLIPICCPIPDPNNPDPRCAAFTCPNP